MKKYLILCSMVLALAVAGCKEKSGNVGDLPRFTITDEQLESWEAGQDFIKLTLTDDAAAGFTSFTNEHMNEKIDVYYGEYKLMTPEIRTPAEPPDIYLMGLNAGDKQRIIDRLPSGKDDADE